MLEFSKDMKFSLEGLTPSHVTVLLHWSRSSQLDDFRSEQAELEKTLTRMEDHI